MLRSGETVFLDDLTIEDAANKLNITITPVPDSGAAFVKALLGVKK